MTYKLLSFIPIEKQIETIRKCWMSHDARWQYYTYQELGIERGNRLNQQVSYETGKVMMYRLMTALDLSPVKSIEELQAILKAILDLFYPSSKFSYKFKRQSDTTLLGVMEYCGIYENVKKAGILDHYECGCFAMRSGWYEALGINVEEELGKHLKKGDKVCEFILEVKKWSMPEKKELEL